LVILGNSLRQIARGTGVPLTTVHRWSKQAYQLLVTSMSE